MLLIRFWKSLLLAAILLGRMGFILSYPRGGHILRERALVKWPPFLFPSIGPGHNKKNTAAVRRLSAFSILSNPFEPTLSFVVVVSMFATTNYFFQKHFTKVMEAIAALSTKLEHLQEDVGVLKTDVGALTTDVGVLKTDVGILKSETSHLSRYALLENVVRARGKQFSTPAAIQSLPDLAMFLNGQQAYEIGESEKSLRSPSEMRSAFFDKNDESRVQKISRTKNNLLNYIFAHKERMESFLKKYLEKNDDVLTRTLLGQAEAGGALTHDLSNFLLTLDVNVSKLNDEAIDGSGAALGMLLFSAAAGLPKPILEVHLDCQGYIAKNGDESATICIGKLQYSPEKIGETLEQLNLHLLLLEAALRAVYENDQLDCQKKAYVFMLDNPTASSSVPFPELIGGTTIIRKYM
jgi:hypothetical protein